MAAGTHQLNNFISRLKAVGLQSPSHYFIKVPGSSEEDNGVLMMCDSINVPGLQIMSSDFRTYGEMRDVPYGVSYPTLNLTVLLDNTMGGKLWFDAWSNQVYDREKREVGYYGIRGDGFAKDIEIYMTDQAGGITYKMIVKECWPKTIGDIQLGYDAKDAIRLNVTLALKYWKVESVTNAALANALQPSKVATDKIQDNEAAKKALQDAISNVTKPKVNNSAYAEQLKTLSNSMWAKTSPSNNPNQLSAEDAWFESLPIGSDLKLPIVYRGGIPMPLEAAYLVDLARSEAIRIIQLHNIL